MSRKWIILITGILLSAFALMAYAGNVHFVGSVRTSSGSFVLEGDAAGLGNGSYAFNLTAYGNALALCQNRGGNTAPGRNPIAISGATTDTYVSGANGRTAVRLHAPDPSYMNPAPVSPTPKQAGCPNGNWNVIGLVGGSTTWTGATLNVVDNGNGAQVLSLRWTCFGAAESCVQN